MDYYDFNNDGSDPLDSFNFDDELSSGGAFFERTFENGADTFGETLLPDVLEPTASPSPPAIFLPSFSAIAQPRQMPGPPGTSAQPQHYGSYGEALSASGMETPLPSAGKCESLPVPSSQMDVYSHANPDPSTPPTTIPPLHNPLGGRLPSMPPPTAGHWPQAGPQAEVLPAPQPACYPHMTPEAHMSPYPQLPDHNHSGATNTYFNDTNSTPYAACASGYEAVPADASLGPATAGNRTRHPPHGCHLTTDASQPTFCSPRNICGGIGVVRRPTNDINPLQRGFGFYQLISHEEPWKAKRLSFGKTIKHEKVVRQTRRKKTSDGESRFTSKDYYGNPPPRPEPWGQVRNGSHTFEYTEEGELRHFLEVNELRSYLYDIPALSIQHQWRARKPTPGEILLETKNRAGLILWIGKVPSQSNYRYPNENSNKCRFRACSRKKNAIRAGEFRVIFDERHNVTGRDIDPFYNAGVVHLYCLEKHFDLVELFDHLDVRIDDRAFEKEDANHGELKPELAQATRRWMSEQWPPYLHWRRQDPWRRRRRTTKFMHSLTRTLTEADMRSETRGKPRQRANRREAANQKATAINCDREIHLGDLDYECAFRQARVEGDNEGARRLAPGQEWDAYAARLALREERNSMYQELLLAGPSSFNPPPGLDVPGEGYSQPAPAHSSSRENMATPAAQSLALPGVDSEPTRTPHSQQAHAEQMEQFAVDLEGLEQYAVDLGTEETNTEAMQEPLFLPVTEGTKSPASECDLWGDFLSLDSAGESIAVCEGAGETRAVTIGATEVGSGPGEGNAEHVVGSPLVSGGIDFRPVAWDDALPPPPLTAIPTLPGLKRSRDADDGGEAGSIANNKRRRSF